MIRKLAHSYLTPDTIGTRQESKEKETTRQWRQFCNLRNECYGSRVCHFSRDNVNISNPNQSRIQFAFIGLFDLFLVFELLSDVEIARKREKKLRLHFFRSFHFFFVIRSLCAHRVWPTHRHTFSKWKWILLTMTQTAWASRQPTNVCIYSCWVFTRTQNAHKWSWPTTDERRFRSTRSHSVDYYCYYQIRRSDINAWRERVRVVSPMFIRTRVCLPKEIPIHATDWYFHSK